MASGVRQVLLLGSALALCPVGALLIGDEPAAPIRRGMTLADLERAAGLHFEPAVHGSVLRQRALMDVASLVYVFAHIAVAAWALVWTWWLHHDRFALARDIFLVTQLLTVVVYVAWPTAPPRLLPRAGFEDTLAGCGARGRRVRAPPAEPVRGDALRTRHARPRDYGPRPAKPSLRAPSSSRWVISSPIRGDVLKSVLSLPRRAASRSATGYCDSGAMW
jgi:hypothetical protein